MARIIDESKLSSIEDAATELIVKNGYGGASISSIAKHAGVAVGYLYRFYSSKEEFVEKLLFQKFEFLIENIKKANSAGLSVKESISSVIDSIAEIVEKSPKDIQFLYVLMHNYSFQISDEQQKMIQLLTEKMFAEGNKRNEIKSEIKIYEFYNMVITIPIVFVNQCIKGFFGKQGWDKSDIERIKTFCISSLCVS